MKKFDTEYITNKKADLEELKVIIKNLFTEDSEEWISLYDTSKKNPNYIQVHYDIGILDDLEPVVKFIKSNLNYEASALDERDFYLIEYRKYENENKFKHYRAFFNKVETIISFIERYMNDKEIDTEKWIDVTSEFTEEIKIEMRENMEKINHEFFGELDLKNGLDDGFGFSDDVIVLWEEEVNGINTTLWYAKSIKITTEILDVFSNFLTNFGNNDEIARKALEAYLLEDSEYIDFHREEIEPDLPEDVKEFVQCMKVTDIGFWVGGEDVDGEDIIIVDYMISPEESDEILAVKFNSNFEIMDIAWES